MAEARAQTTPESRLMINESYHCMSTLYLAGIHGYLWVPAGTSWLQMIHCATGT
jgi:hypothetical protein